MLASMHASDIIFSRLIRVSIHSKEFDRGSNAKQTKGDSDKFNQNVLRLVRPLSTYFYKLLISRQSFQHVTLA